MSKHTYRSKKVNEIDWDQLRGKWAGQSLVFAVDVAKRARVWLRRVGICNHDPNVSCKV